MADTIQGPPAPWSALSHIALGRYAEYFTKMAMIRQGWDVYSAEVDDKGIDFVLRVNSGRYCDIQVKSVRWPGSQYVFIPKKKLVPRPDCYVVLVLFEEGAEPRLYAIPSLVWLDPKGMFVSRDYATGKSEPEFGINISQKARADLETYRFPGGIGK